MTQRGEHTWDLTITYHRCSQCGYILENRDIYQYRKESEYKDKEGYYKDLECPRCHHKWTAKKPARSTIGPFLGEPEPVEIDWSEHK